MTMPIASIVSRAFSGVATALLAGSIASASTSHAAIGFGQVDTFQDGTTMDWSEGAPSPNPPMNIPTGGPDGADDAFLENISSGGFGAGAKMIMFNLVQWTGDFTDAGVDRVTAHMANFGSSNLFMRLAFRGGPNNTVYASTAAAVLPADGLWHVIDFDLNDSGLTNVGGADSLADALGNVIEFRLLSAAGGPSFNGDAVNGDLGVDNITAHDIANFRLRISGLALLSGVPRISFTTEVGRTHRVERKTALSDASWIPLSNAMAVAGTGGVVQVDDTDAGAGSGPARFYRAVLLPQ